jgi:hypothetical protein
LLSAAQFAVNAQLPAPLVMVTVVPEIEHDPLAVITAVVLALVVAVTLKEVPDAALAGAPVKVAVGLALTANTVPSTEAGPQLLSGAKTADISQAPVPLVMVIEKLPPEMEYEHCPEIPIVGVLVDRLPAEPVKVALYGNTWGSGGIKTALFPAPNAAVVCDSVAAT